MRALSGQIDALHQGQRLPQVGNITMDQLILDITDHLGKVGDSVTLLGRDGDTTISPRTGAIAATPFQGKSSAVSNAVCRGSRSDQLSNTWYSGRATGRWLSG